MLRKIVAIGLMALLSLSAWADGADDKLQARVSLWAIASDHTTESGDDEIYIGVGRYKEGSLQYYYRVPEAPMHLLSRYFDRVNDLLLWHGEVGQDEKVELAFTVAEEDYPPWDLDDQLMTVRLLLERNDGQLSTIWQSPDGKPIELEEVQMDEGLTVQRLIFEKDEGDFQLDFLVTLDDENEEES